MNDNIELQQRIMMEFKGHPKLKSTQIEVAVRDDIVILSGSTDSYGDKITARHLTQQFPGIKSIEEKIEVAIS